MILWISSQYISCLFISKLSVRYFVMMTEKFNYQNKMAPFVQLKIYLIYLNLLKQYFFMCRA